GGHPQCTALCVTYQSQQRVIFGLRSYCGVRYDGATAVGHGRPWAAERREPMGVVMTEKQPTSFRLSGECLDLLARLAAALGLSQAGVIEMVVRKLARTELTDRPPAGRGGPKKGKGKGRHP